MVKDSLKNAMNLLCSPSEYHTAESATMIFFHTFIKKKKKNIYIYIFIYMMLKKKIGS